MIPRVLLRTGGGAAIGLGHIRRCQVLAQEFRARVAEVFWAVDRDMQTYLTAQGEKPTHLLAETVDVHGFDHVVADINWSGNAGRAAQEIAAFAEGTATVTVIDSMPPDHFMAAPNGAPDLLVTPYLNARAFRPEPQKGLWLEGGGHAILDPELLRADATSRSDKRILVSCGGSDPNGLTLRIVEALADQPNPVDIVIGPLFSAELAQDLYRLKPAHFTYHDAPKGLTGLISGASLVVGRVGILRYEAAVLGRRGIYLHAGPDYRDYLEGFAKSGVAEVHFTTDDRGEEKFLERLGHLEESDFQPNPLARAAIDGKGSARVAQAVLGLKKGLS